MKLQIAHEYIKIHETHKMHNAIITIWTSSHAKYVQIREYIYLIHHSEN